MLTPFCRCSTQQLVLSVRVCVWECASVCVLSAFFSHSPTLSLCHSSFAFWQLELSLAINTHTHTQVFRRAQHLSFNWFRLFIYLWLIYLFFVRLVFTFFSFLFLYFFFVCYLQCLPLNAFRFVWLPRLIVSFRFVWFGFVIWYFFLSMYRFKSIHMLALFFILCKSIDSY